MKNLIRRNAKNFYRLWLIPLWNFLLLLLVFSHL